MSKKPSNDQAADDWAGLAQNLFGINLGKGGDEDLLDDDMFKVDIPKPPEPPPVILQSEVEFAPEAPVPPVAATAALVQPVAKLPAKPPAPRVAKPKPVEADSFGAGVVEEEAPSEEVALTFEEATAETDDDGLTLPEDYDAEGLTLPADYDDGLTLAPEVAAISQTSEDFDDEGDEEEDEDASDTEVLPTPRGEKEGEGSSDTRRRRQPRRTREDAYWDMLENWEWEEIPDHDSPRSDGDRPRSSSRGDRGDRRGGGGRSRRGGSRDDRPRSDDRSPAGDRPARTERPVTETAGAVPGGTDDRPQRPRRDDRPRDDRGRRDDRPRGERRPERDDRRRDEPRTNTPQQSPTAASSGADDFGLGIFEEPTVSTPAPSHREPERPRRSTEDVVAQSSRAADAVVRSDRGASSRPIEDDLVWPDDDSDVRSAPANSVVETSGLPSAETAGESDETVPESDVRPLDEDDDSLRPRRRRRRRRGPRSESSAAPPDGNEGTTFDLSDALDTDSETPDFIPSASAEDSASSDEFGAGVVASDSSESTSDEQSSEQRGRRRRRRRRRPSDGSAPETAEQEDREPSDSDDADEVAEPRNEGREERTVIKPITYSNIPSWEEAIKYLLQPNLVGRNLGPDDADDSLENDPRGSGGAEPTPPPPQRRRSSGGSGGGRGRRR